MRLHDGRYALTLSDDEPAGRRPDYLRVSVEGEGLRAILVSYDSDGFSGLVSYFDDLASDAFDGWQGERVFESLEGDLRLVATTRRDLELAVVLKPLILEAGWLTQVELRLERGEQIRQASRDLAEELRRQ